MLMYIDISVYKKAEATFTHLK